MTDTLGDGAVTLRCSLLWFEFKMSVIDSDILVTSWSCLLGEVQEHFGSSLMGESGSLGGEGDTWDIMVQPHFPVSFCCLGLMCCNEPFFLPSAWVSCQPDTALGQLKGSELRDLPDQTGLMARFMRNCFDCWLMSEGPNSLWMMSSWGRWACV